MNDIKKRKILDVLKIVIVVFLLIAGLLGSAIFFTIRNKQEEKSTGSNTEEVVEGLEEIETDKQTKYEYINLEALYFLKEASSFTDEFDTYLSHSDYEDVDTVTVLDDITKMDDTAYDFKIQLDDSDESIIECIFDTNTRLFTYALYSSNAPVEPVSDPFYIDGEENSEVESDQELTTDAIDCNNPEDYDAPISITNEIALDGVLSESALKSFKDGLLKFLVGQNEYRRVVSVKDNSIVVAAESISFQCTFDTARLDNKNVTVGYSLSSEEFQFILE